MTEHFVTDAGKAGRRSIADEQQLAALEAARLERKVIRERRLAMLERTSAIRRDLEDSAGIVFLDISGAYDRRRAGKLGRRKGERKKWDRDYRAALGRVGRVEERMEAERRRIAHLMHSAPGASSAHRGTRSTYNAADPGSVRREPDAPRERLTDGKRHPVTVARVSDSGRMRP